ncbi:MAG: pentapeptide repeat-containing protein [Deltaproteobacteria bacterium]
MQRIKNYVPFFIIVPSLIIFFLFGPFNFNKTVSGKPDDSEGTRTEAEFAEDGDLSAAPESDIVVVFLEPPGSKAEDGDTGGAGFDVIPYRYAEATERVFCWRDDNGDAEHHTTLSDSEGDEILTVTANGECVTELIEPGDYRMSLYHDGKSDKRITVFIIPEGDKSILNTTTDEAADDVATFLDTNKCAGCNLRGVNLNKADLSGVDLSEAILNDAILVDSDLSEADLSGAELRDADLSRANLKGADLSGANLSGAILINADLTDANLLQANLENADTTGAEFSGAQLTGTLAAGTKTTSGGENQAKDIVSTRAVFTCSGNLPPGNAGDPDDLEVTGNCMVGAGTYHYRNVNIYNGGTLEFMDADIDFWAKSILIEKDSSLIAGSPANPIGNNGTLTIHLYGSKDDKAGIECKTDAMCGIDVTVNPMNTVNPSSCQTSVLPDGTTDCFYEYMAPDPVSGETGFFGSKVLAVSFGGTLQMYGKKGATFSDLPSSHSGTSWARLNVDGILPKGATSLTLDRDVDWDVGDHIVITTTDYLPGHSEKLEITGKTGNRQFDFKVLDPHTNAEIPGGLQYPHNGKTYSLEGVPGRLNLDINVDGEPAVETRAAVALLSRSIRIVSGGDNIGEDFGPPTPGNYFGGHMMARQGVKSLEIQGVEFYQLGQGGRKGRYPAHLHLLRKSPGAFVKDSSIHDSMTRWVTLHGTQEVTLARNVGFMSIGHGYYLEDGTEINNKLYSNLGILARAAVKNTQNPREVPGILAAAPSRPLLTNGNLITSYSDYMQPTVFWFTNGWNDLEYNMAAGATACGACYWAVNVAVSGPSRRQKWESYASIKPNPGRSATAPIKKFKGNYCSTAMNSYNATVSTTPCEGVGIGGSVKIEPVPNLLAPAPPLSLVGDIDSANEFYYPRYSANPNATICSGTDCSTVPECSGDNVDNCAVTVLDRYTSAFNWTETNFSAIWLRRAFFTVINSAITNVLGAGLTFVTGGDYTQSSLLPGSFMLAAKNVFIGNTEDGNPFSSNAGPFSQGGLSCENPISDNNYCLSVNEGISMPLSNFAMNQRLFNIYDGPANQSSNAYLDITKTDVTDCTPEKNGTCSDSDWMYGRVLGVPRDVEEVINGNDVKRVVKDNCILPNAAIAWKQPNGFYYPPAFHSDNLYFKNVDIRHFVLEPLFEPGTFNTDFPAVKENYCVYNSASFQGWTAIDRQTILNDDDGSLTGVKKTISVNEDPFFGAPIEQFQCRSDATAKTSPYEYVSTVIYPGCGQGCGADWTTNCTAGCYGVPLIRQFLTGPEEMEANPDTEIRMMGPAISGRINLTANNANYYIDTTRNQVQDSFPLRNKFKANETYYTFLIFAKPEIRQTYQFYVGQDDSIDEDNPQIVNAVRTNIANLAVQFDNIPGGWPSSWEREYNSSTGILSITVDMNEFKQNFDKAKEESCKPISFCEFKSNSCQCSDQLKIDDPDLYAECQRIDICRWSGNDPDCPVFDVGGQMVPRCLGFGITMPDSFVADDVDRRPQPVCFPNDGDWNVPWLKVPADLAGQECFDLPTPDAMFCKVKGSPGGGVPGPPEPPVNTPEPPVDTVDQDGDGVPDAIDADSDNDGIPDGTETATNGISSLTSTRLEIPADPDGDGIPNELDLDSDGDGLTDHFEAGGTDDANGDGIADNFSDADGDGLNDAYDPDQGGILLPLPDTDGDGVPDFLDNVNDSGVGDSADAGSDSSCAISGDRGVKGGLAGLLVYALIPAGVFIRRRLRIRT